MTGHTQTRDLGSNELESLPDFAFSNFKHLKELRLANNGLQELSKEVFSGLDSALKVLSLSGNALTEAPSEAFQHLASVEQLHLDGNGMGEIPNGTFRRMSSLRRLWLDDNRLKVVPSTALSYLPALEALTLTMNEIQVLPDNSFTNLANLQVLLLKENQIRTLGDSAFSGLNSLSILEMDDNALTVFPAAVSSLSTLAILSLMYNKIEYLADNTLSNNKELSVLRIKNNPLMSFGKFAFSHMPKLTKIIVSEARDQTVFPDLTGSANLEQVELDRAAIRSIPQDLCTKLPKMTRLDVHSNRVSRLPDFTSCAELRMLSLGNNDLTTLEGKPFQGLGELKDLILSHNYIETVPSDAFEGLLNLQYLDLQHNKIGFIDREAFAPLGCLEDLNLGENSFSELPSKGLGKIKNLKTFNNRQLKDFPPTEDLPHVQLLTLSYAYHCCEFIREEDAQKTDPSEKLSEEIVWLEPSTYEGHDTSLWQLNLTTVWSAYARGNGSSHYNRAAEDVWTHFGDDYDYAFDDDNQELPSSASPYMSDYRQKLNAQDYVMTQLAKPPISCKPMPGPFMPCDDLMGWWSLRCGVWIVFLLALLGNGAVLFISLLSQRKMDVPRFLICNLACADFMMGVYLGFLAVVDALTLGEFKKHAIRWQTSAACQVAGFLGVLSSELSVFTLTVITMERFYAITHAMHLNKRLSLRHAGYIVLCCWCMALTLAILPLFGISDYRKFAVCLPFEISDSVSLGYVCFIMFVNLVAFGIIVACYGKMYCSVRGSQAWNSNDSRIAKRMALLVFTDFACWAPISFFSLTAAFGLDILSLNDAKVFTIFVLPLNSCANPFLYAILTKQFKKDCGLICKRLEESAMNRSLSRFSHRNVSLTWGSSRRPSVLNSFFNTSEPRKGRLHASIAMNGRIAHRHLVTSAGLALREGLRAPNGIANTPTTVSNRNQEESCCRLCDREHVVGSGVSSGHDCLCHCHLASARQGRQGVVKVRRPSLLDKLMKKHHCAQRQPSADENLAHDKQQQRGTSVKLAPPGESLDPAKNPHLAQGISPRTSPGGMSGKNCRSKCSPGGRTKSSHVNLCCHGNARFSNRSAGAGYSHLVAGPSTSQSDESTSDAFKDSTIRDSESCDVESTNNNHDYMNVTPDMITELQHLRGQSSSSGSSHHGNSSCSHGDVSESHSCHDNSTDCGSLSTNGNDGKCGQNVSVKHRYRVRMKTKKRPEPEGSEATDTPSTQSSDVIVHVTRSPSHRESYVLQLDADHAVMATGEDPGQCSLNSEGVRSSELITMSCPLTGTLGRKVESAECCNLEGTSNLKDSASVPLLTVCSPEGGQVVSTTRSTSFLDAFRSGCTLPVTDCATANEIPDLRASNEVLPVPSCDLDGEAAEETDLLLPGASTQSGHSGCDSNVVQLASGATSAVLNTDCRRSAQL